MLAEQRKHEALSAGHMHEVSSAADAHCVIAPSSCKQSACLRMWTIRPPLVLHLDVVQHICV